MNLEQQTAPVSAPVKKQSAVGAIFFGFWCIIAYFLISSVPAIIGEVKILISLIAEIGNDMTVVMPLFQERIMDPDFLTNTQFVAGILLLIVTSIWYLCGFKNKNEKTPIKDSAQKLLSVPFDGFLLFGGLALHAFALLIAAAVFTLFPSSAPWFEFLMDSVTSGSTLLSSLYVILIGPIVEEVLLRGILFRKLEKAFPMIPCIILSGVFFGIMHLNLVQGLYAIPIGIFLGYLTYKTKSVIPAIIVHILNNSVFSYISDLYDIEKYWWISVIILFVSGGIALVCAKKTAFLHSEKKQVTA